MSNLLQLIAIYGVLSAVAVLGFWFLQIRFGNIEGLDPEHVLVRAFRKKHVAANPSTKAVLVGPEVSKYIQEAAVAAEENNESQQECLAVLSQLEKFISNMERNETHVEMVIDPGRLLQLRPSYLPQWKKHYSKRRSNWETVSDQSRRVVSLGSSVKN